MVAGGTGGHINAAIAIGEYYKKLGYEITYITGQRYLDYQIYKDKKTIHLPSLGLRYKNPFKILKSILLNIYALFLVAFYIIKINPKFVFGTGGYVCGPVLLVSKVFFKPVFILEQNAVLGLTNRILSKFADKIFINLIKTRGFDKSVEHKIKVVGNPIRFDYHPNPQKKDSINVLVFGGSLGAEQINTALELVLQKCTNTKISIIHQTGKKGKAISIKSTVKYEQFEYLDNMSKYYNWADKIICRAGASSISELQVVAKPCLLIPFPGATDDHQTLNAKALKNESDFDVEIVHKDISLPDLAVKIETFINNESLNSGTSRENKTLDKINQELLSYF